MKPDIKTPGLVMLFLVLGIAGSAQITAFHGQLSHTINPFPEPFMFDAEWITKNKIKDIQYSSTLGKRNGSLEKKPAEIIEMKFDSAGKMIGQDRLTGDYDDGVYRYEYDTLGCPSEFFAEVEGEEDSLSGLTYECNKWAKPLKITSDSDTMVFEYDLQGRLMSEWYTSDPFYTGADLQVEKFKYDSYGRISGYEGVEALIGNYLEGPQDDTLYATTEMIKYQYEDKGITRIVEYYADVRFNEAINNGFDTTAIVVYYTEFNYSNGQLNSVTYFAPDETKSFADFFYNEQGLVEQVQYYYTLKNRKMIEEVVKMEYGFFD